MKPEEKETVVDKVLVERLHYLTDPLKRLQALEGATLASILFTVLVGLSYLYFGRTWILVVTAFIFVNTLFIVFRYFKEREQYLSEGGEL